MNPNMKPNTQQEFMIKWLHLAEEELRNKKYKSAISNSWLNLIDCHSGDKNPEFEHWKKVLREWEKNPNRARAIGATRFTRWFQTSRGYLLETDLLYHSQPVNYRNDVVREVYR